jgi:hypothetical protein
VKIDILLLKVKTQVLTSGISQNSQKGFYLGMHWISGWPDIRPDNPAFFDIRYPAGYRILLTGYPAGYRILK